MGPNSVLLHRAPIFPVLALAGVGLFAAVMVAASMGGVSIAPERIARHLASLGGLADTVLAPREAALFTEIRLPRIVLAIFVGAAMSLAGAALQAVFRNPLADPGLIGVSGGAAFAAAAAIVLGLPGPMSLPLAAFGGGVGATALVFLLSRKNGTISIGSMLLAGIAVNALAGAGIGLFSYLGDDLQLRQLTFWTLGSLSGATWHQVMPAIFLMSLGAAGLLHHARAMDIFVLGEREAFALGLSPARFSAMVVLLAALAVGAAVASAGPIGFVGLMVPHIARMLLGPGHVRVMGASLILGALAMVVADTLARTIAMPAEVPIGLLLSLGGAPFFLWLLRRAGPMTL